MTEIFNTFSKESDGPKKLLIYFSFLEECKVKYSLQGIETPEEEKPSQLHHICPKFRIKDYLKENGVLEEEKTKVLLFQDSSINIILLSKRDHIESHKILFDLFKDPRDKSATNLLIGSLNEAVKDWKRAGAVAVHKQLKATGKTLWNTEFQKEQARKANFFPNIKQIRSLGGKKGAKNSNTNRVITNNERYLFMYKEKPFMCIFGYSYGSDLVELLNSLKRSNLKRVSNLLDGSRKTAYGWSCECLLPDPNKKEKKKKYKKTKQEER